MTTMDEIDLRGCIRVLVRRRYWIVACGLVVAALALAVSLILPKGYVARATVVATGSRVRVQLDSRVQDTYINPRTVAAGYPALATGDELLMVLMGDVNAQRPADMEPLDLEQMKNQVEAADAGDPSIVMLSVSASRPEEAARVANRWAELFVDHLQMLFGSISDVALVEQQARDARTTLEQADEQLTVLRRDFGLGYVRGSEDSTTGDLSRMLGITYRLQLRTVWLGSAEQRAEQIAQLLTEARSVATHARGASPVLMAGLIGDLANLGILGSSTTGPLVQINLHELDAEAGVAALIDALEAKQAANQATIVQLRQEVTGLQSELAIRQLDLERLERERQVSQETYLTLSNRLQTLKLEATQVARVASRAAVPGRAASPRPLMNTAVAGLLALVISAVVVCLREEWWGADSSTLEQPPPGDGQPDPPSATLERHPE